MTVQELIDTLNELPNKSLEVVNDVNDEVINFVGLRKDDDTQITSHEKANDADYVALW